MDHICKDVDARHQAALKSESPRHRVVVDLVFGLFGSVVGGDAVCFEPARHGVIPRLSAAFSRQFYAAKRPWQGGFHPVVPSHFYGRWSTTRRRNATNDS